MGRVQLGQRAALYCRVSTADQSCARQERDLAAFANRSAGCAGNDADERGTLPGAAGRLLAIHPLLIHSVSRASINTGALETSLTVRVRLGSMARCEP